ncbi:MAG: sigma-54-dependent Fis family transcriptional regulator [Deltaproteobacteria bacterium]|nr:sigma-54-dependent Fis family transcriptional regulator [Deltaproteobacteria bacterium]
MNERLLVVDDEASMRELLQIMLSKEGYEVVLATSGEEAMDLYQKQRPDLVITDIKMPGMSGLDLIREIRAVDSLAAIIAITAYASADDAVRAVREGAYDYISKPFQVEDLRSVIRNALEARKFRKEAPFRDDKVREQFAFSEIIGRSREMMDVFDMINRVATSKASVLILGESGTGKELVAKAIHAKSPRADKPFVVVNCSAIPETLIESELFGHVKGAFTGAVTNKAGLVEEAHTGTLFLDEVGEIPVFVQTKLLRFLQDREFRRVGGVESGKVDVRVIAATNRNLETEMQESRFREDLYYRLNVIRVRIPPLREREEDIPLLVDHFLKEFAREQKKDIKKVSALAMRVLRNYHYPGNVRELENIIERCVTLEQSDQLNAEHLPDRLVESVQRDVVTGDPDFPEGGINLDQATQDLEKKLILRALEMAGGNRARASRLLGITLRSLRYRLMKLGMDTDEATP